MKGSAAKRLDQAVEQGGSTATSLCDQAYAAIKQRIITNRLPAGSYIDEREIATELEMSRTPVREALILLQNEGFVAIEPRKGVRVLPISPDDMQEIYDVLTGLETMAVALAAARKLTEENLQPLRDALLGMEAALADDDVLRWTQCDESFHRELLKISGNARLTETGLRFRDQVQRAHLLVNMMQPQRSRSTQAHKCLYELLREGDVEGARENHYEQRMRAGRELMETVRKFGLRNL